MKVNEKDEKDGVVSVQPSPANGILVSDRFKLSYFGCLVIDKRYTSCMLPWIVAEIKRKCERQILDVVVENTQVCGTSNETAIEHGLVSISKCIKLEGKEASTFAYLTKDPDDTATCSCHVFEAENTSKASKFLTTLKKALEECKRQQPAVKEANDVKSDSPADQAPKSEVTKFNVTYVGKLAVSHRKAPPTLIDTSVERFRHHNQQVLLTTKLDSLKREQVETKDTIEKDEAFQLAKTTSFDEKQEKYLSVEDLTAPRPRSVSDDGTSHHKGCIPPHPAKPPRKMSSVFSESRNLVMIISVNSISFSSSLSRNILMERKVQEISFCQQGTVEPEHFGFICHDVTSSRYYCYVFRAESKHAVDSIMKSLKQAFTSAWQAVGSNAPCENCPLRKLHCLCQALEGEKPVDQEITIRHHLLDNLGDSVVDDLRRKYQAEAKRRDVVEQNEIMMSLLRQLYEEMQKVHRHSPNSQVRQSDNANKEKPPTKFIEKAKRSLGDIFGRSKSRNVKSDQEVSSSDEADCKVATNRLAAPAPQKKASLTDTMPPPLQSITELQRKPKRTHRRSYSDITQIYKSPSKINNDLSESREHVSDEESFVIKNPKSESTKTSPKKNDISRKPSYRRAIFDSVVTPSKLPDGATIAESEKSYEKKSREQLRALWRKAIMDQRTLIRMEKENSKLKAGEGIAFNKRLKLEYEEVLLSSIMCSETWTKLLAGEKVVEKDDLVEAIKQGIPKNRRGEIWQFLTKQDLLRNKRSGSVQHSCCYKELKEKRSIHQHAILIDCNRTFPAHPYFSQQVGVGQFALFNLLKVYSNLDSELGYCQGLSFVAGILLMHLGEEEAFDVLVHLNYNYGLRQQYMPDMAGLRVQFYQYSRLLHDYYPNLYDHFENYEVTPALYAASWFLTLFASLFPVSFASRVLDLVCFAGLQMIFKVAISMVGRFQDEILARESFETIVEFFKNDLPKVAAVELENIVEDVLTMEIEDQLLRFEIEYQVFQEDEINPSLMKPLHDKNEKLGHENSSLKNKVNYLKNELHEYKRKERNMTEKIKKLQCENDRLRVLAFHATHSTTAAMNGDDSHGETQLVENCTSPTDENTSDSFEHITGADETDDDIDALSCDSPLTIEDYLSEKENSPVISPPPADESLHSWTKL